jgi:cytochrome b subunit of formate dehydrogenase
VARQSRLFVLNSVIFLVLLLQLLLGIRLWLVALLGWEYSLVVLNLHLINGLIFVALVTIHLYMNRGWIRLQIYGPAGKRK